MKKAKSTKMVIYFLITFNLWILPGFVLGQTVGVFIDFATPQHEFAAGDIKTALEAKGHTVEIKDLSTLTNNYVPSKVVIALESNTFVTTLLMASGGSGATDLGEQAYALRTTTTPQLSYWVLGGDDNGAMYGGLQVAEYINFNGLIGSYTEDESPHVRFRGIKFNIPLDAEAPTYNGNWDGTSHQVAVEHVWDLEFWKTWFDEMARHRYNILSLWNSHPFVCMLNMANEYPEYAGIAINDVHTVDKNEDPVFVKSMTIDQKIQHWKDVMKYGRDRGFGVIFSMWNLRTYTADGVAGIDREDPTSDASKKYIYRCVKMFLETYPDLEGIGITNGEKLGSLSEPEREVWAWETYGQAILDHAKAHTDRNLVFIHRHHDSDYPTMVEKFGALMDQENVRFDLSFKYSQAHAHSAVAPDRWYSRNMEDFLEPKNLRSWLTIRNDDWYFLHWGDHQFVRDYISSFPSVENYVNAFYIGPDGWVFSKVFTSKDPYYKNKDALSIQRTWYMQKLWGRIGYNPSVSVDLFKNHMGVKYPEASSENLFEAWTKASQSIRLANEQVTGNDWDLDFDWWPEAWSSRANGFRTLDELRITAVMDGSTLCSIGETANDNCGAATSALTTADKIEALAKSAIQNLGSIGYGANTDLKLTLKDLYAQANLGLYDANKFRAAIYLEQGGKSNEAQDAIGTAYCYWMNYTDIMDDLYIGVNTQRNHDLPNWHAYDGDALQDYNDAGGSGTPDCSDIVGVPETKSKLKIINTNVKLWVYDLHGKLVSIVNSKSGISQQSHVLHSLRNNKSLPNGIYLTIIKSKNTEIGRKKVYLVN